MRSAIRISCLVAAALFCAPAYGQSPAETANPPKALLETAKRHTTLASTIPENGDQNPYAIVVAPVSSGNIEKDDVLVDNFNNAGNLQGAGSTIVIYRPSTKQMSLFAAVPKELKGCPGGIGLSTAMTMLKSGWVIVGSAPSTDGTTATKGAGCLIVLDSKGKVAGTIAGPKIDAPWGNMAVIDKGNAATLFVSNAGFGVGALQTDSPLISKATVLRIELSIPDGKAPIVKSQTVVADGLGQRASRDVFLIGPTGLALAKDGSTLYVSDAIHNRIVAIADATTRKTSAGQGREITKDGLLQRPLAMLLTPAGSLVTTNGTNGQAVEIDPVSGKQLFAQWLDANKAQNPPGNGDLFGIALTPRRQRFLLCRRRSKHAGCFAMSGCPFKNVGMMTRRGFFTAVGGLGLFGAGAALSPKIAPLIGNNEHSGAPDQLQTHQTLPFFGVHQQGIVTPQQGYSYFAALDLMTLKREDVVQLLKRWTAAGARMTAGKTAEELGDPTKASGDSGEALHLPPCRLTLTFGFGPGLFTRDGTDRYGLGRHRPEALTDLPKFNGDQLMPDKTGGDISIQACADDQQVAFHAVRQLVRMAEGFALMRWAQSGFLSGAGGKETPRNLMGFKDGTQNPRDREVDRFVWVGDEGPDWMRGGSYAVSRRIRISLEHWDNTDVQFQEEVIGRRKYSGAPLSGKDEFDALDLKAVDKDGNLAIPDTAHVRLASPEANDGAQILRRGYSYNDGVNFIAERWPPWKQAVEYDAGLHFVCYQRDHRKGFSRIFENMAKIDMLNQFATHHGSGLFACPAGAREGEYIGQKLFEA